MQIPSIKISLIHPTTIMAPKDSTTMNPMLTSPVDLDCILLTDKVYKIAETQHILDLFELRCWFRDNYLDQSNEISL